MASESSSDQPEKKSKTSTLAAYHKSFLRYDNNGPSKSVVACFGTGLPIEEAFYVTASNFPFRGPITAVVCLLNLKEQVEQNRGKDIDVQGRKLSSRMIGMSLTAVLETHKFCLDAINEHAQAAKISIRKNGHQNYFRKILETYASQSPLRNSAKSDQTLPLQSFDHASGELMDDLAAHIRLENSFIEKFKWSSDRLLTVEALQAEKDKKRVPKDWKIWVLQDDGEYAAKSFGEDYGVASAEFDKIVGGEVVVIDKKMIRLPKNQSLRSVNKSGDPIYLCRRAPEEFDSDADDESDDDSSSSISASQVQDD